MSRYATHGGDVVASHGDETHRPIIETALTYDGEFLGILAVTAPRRGLTDGGRALLAALAPQVAVVARAAALNTELDEARRHLVDATQAERSRLRGDLHDGLAPSLSGVALGLESAQRALRGDPDRAERILQRLHTEVRGAVEEIRRILAGLRPPALDTAGLVGALRANSSDPTGGPAVDVTADADLPSLDPDVEAAAYRIAIEALTNARRHAHATHCTVRLSADDSQLRIEVHDDGHGMPAVPHEGIGLTSMRHRAESLGGALEVQSGSAGTTVVARLPGPRS
jgi:signal transduction histidine kinase